MKNKQENINVVFAISVAFVWLLNALSLNELNCKVRLGNDWVVKKHYNKEVCMRRRLKLIRLCLSVIRRINEWISHKIAKSVWEDSEWVREPFAFEKVNLKLHLLTLSIKPFPSYSFFRRLSRSSSGSRKLSRQLAILQTNGGECRPRSSHNDAHFMAWD